MLPIRPVPNLFNFLSWRIHEWKLTCVLKFERFKWLLSAFAEEAENKNNNFTTVPNRKICLWKQFMKIGFLWKCEQATSWAIGLAYRGKSFLQLQFFQSDSEFLWVRRNSQICQNLSEG